MQHGLGGERGRLGHVAHHEEPGDVHAEVPCGGDVLGGDVRLRAVGGDPYRTNAERVRALQVADRSDAGEQQGGEPGPGDGGGDRRDPVGVRVTARTVGDARAGQSVPVRHLNRVDSCRVQRGGDRRGLLRREPMPGGVHAVAQRDVLDVQFHRTASLSPARIAAEVMMSRFPA